MSAQKDIKIMHERLKLLPLIGLAWCALAQSSPVANGYVTYAGTYGNGDVYVELDVQIQEPDCPSNRFDVPATHPNAKTILATAYTAMATQKRVRVVTVGCWASLPTLDVSRYSFFLIFAD